MPNHDQMQTEPRPEPTANATANNAEPGAEPTANQSEPFGERDGEPGAQQWRSVQEIALLEGLTERAIQKRCQRGYYVARSVEGEKGEVWEIDAGSIKARPNKSEPTANRSQLKAEPGAERTANRSRSDDERQAIIPLAISQKLVDRDADEIARQREEIIFLRGLVEQHQRSEAELRASLRAALSAMPKQLTAGDAATPPSASVQTDTAAGAPSVIKQPGQREAGATSMKKPRPLWRAILGLR